MTTTRNTLRVLRYPVAAILAAMFLIPMIKVVPALGQGRTMAPVIVAIPGAFPDAAALGGTPDNIIAITLREPGRTDIIILNPEYATPAALSAAVAGLKRNRVALPNIDKGVMLVARSATPPRSRQQHSAMTHALERIRLQKPSRIGSIGLGRWYEFPAHKLGM